MTEGGTLLVKKKFYKCGKCCATETGLVSKCEWKKRDQIDLRPGAGGGAPRKLWHQNHFEAVNIENCALKTLDAKTLQRAIRTDWKEADKCNTTYLYNWSYLTTGCCTAGQLQKVSLSDLRIDH